MAETWQKWHYIFFPIDTFPTIDFPQECSPTKAQTYMFPDQGVQNISFPTYNPNQAITKLVYTSSFPRTSRTHSFHDATHPHHAPHCTPPPQHTQTHTLGQTQFPNLLLFLKSPNCGMQLLIYSAEVCQQFNQQQTAA